VLKPVKEGKEVGHPADGRDWLAVNERALESGTASQRLRTMGNIVSVVKRFQ
jgi:hypothetical protein